MRQRRAVAATERRLRVHSVRARVDAARAEEGDAEAVTRDKPTIPEVMPLVRAFYEKPGNGVGGALHIVLEDGNVDDGSVRFCLNEARKRADEDAIRLAEILLRMS